MFPCLSTGKSSNRHRMFESNRQGITDYSMPKQTSRSRQVLAKLSRWNEKLLQCLSIFVLPIAIGLVSLLALFVWQTQYPATNPQALPIRVIKEPASPTELTQVMAQLQKGSTTQFYDTQRSELPFWLSFRVPAEVMQHSLMIEFPSRHATDVACWNGNTLRPLGSANRQSASGAISAIKAGFALELDASLKDALILCRTSAMGPARLSALSWRDTDLQLAVNEFHRKSGLLDSGIIVLAIFVLLTALINRNSLYVLFAAWLVLNLRMGALSAGWDTQWLGQAVPYNILMQGRMLSITLYYVLTLTLFTSLFKDELPQVGHRSLVTAFQWTCVPLLILSALVPAAQFLPLIWTLSGIGIFALAYLLIRILQRTRSLAAMWYGAAIGITLVSSLYEVLAAALGVKNFIGSVNSVTAALSSSLLTALAIAEQMRQEHAQRLQAQAELAHTFEVMPIGLFTLDMQGRFLSANPALLAMLGPTVLTKGGASWQAYFTAEGWTHLHQMVQSTKQNEMEIQGVGITGSKCFLAKATLAHDRIEGSLQDITERNLIEMELRAAKLAAEAASQDKSRFLASASHDLRQPAHAMGMFVAQLAELPHDDHAKRLVIGLEASVNALQDMLEGFFDMSRLNSDAAQIQSVAFPIERIFAQLRGSLGGVASEKGLRLRFRPSSAWVRSEPSLLHRILLNLVGNAVRYTQHGTVLVACRPTRDGRQLRIEVRDSGIGIAAQHHEAIFQEFFQVANPERNRNKGLGVGLNIVARACRVLNHSLTLHSALGRGSCFTLTLPLAPGRLDSVQTDSAGLMSIGDLTGLRLLVIEDDPLGRSALATLLSSWGCTAEFAEGAQMACARYRHDQAPDVIISDFRLGDGVNGIHAVRLVRETAGHPIAACLISGDTNQELRRLAQAAGLPLLHKPVRPAKLRSLLRHLMQNQYERR